jgi:hypothetical protein
LAELSKSANIAPLSLWRPPLAAMCALPQRVLDDELRPQAINDVTVNALVENLKAEHAAWIAVYNSRVRSCDGWGASQD